MKKNLFTEAIETLEESRRESSTTIKVGQFYLDTSGKLPGHAQHFYVL